MHKKWRKTYRGVDVIKEFSKEGGVSNLSVFTCTTLRKHVATLTQSFEISKLDQDQLASFLGHDIRVHRSFYRSPIEIVEKAKVAKLLLAANKGIYLPWDKVGDVDEELEEYGEDMAEEDNKEIENDRDPDFTEPDSTVTEPISVSNSGAYSSSTKNVSESTRVKTHTRLAWSGSEIEAQGWGFCGFFSVLPIFRISADFCSFELSALLSE